MFIDNATEQSYTPTINGLYAVYVIQHGCTDRSECVLITGLEISNENADKVLIIYPNPNSGKFIIELNDNMVVSLYNTIGSLVYKKNMLAGKNIIDIENLHSGTYLIKAQNEQLIIENKILLFK